MSSLKEAVDAQCLIAITDAAFFGWLGREDTRRVDVALQVDTYLRLVGSRKDDQPQHFLMLQCLQKCYVA